MKPFNEMNYHPDSEKLVEILCGKTHNENPLFFRVQVAYYFALAASIMRTKVATHDRGVIPINLYALNLATSGSGKGYSMNVMENEVLHLFRNRFMEETLPQVAEKNLTSLAKKRAIRKNTDEDDELAKIKKEFERLGTFAFSFDSGTSPAVKQMRHMLLMAGAGSINLQIDEIGSNLVKEIEVLNTFLELFDVGNIKQKLTKNTDENNRGEEIVGKTPANMLLFGTPNKLLNGGQTEEELYSMLETGYARRCFFGYSRTHSKMLDMTPEEVYLKATDKSHNTFLQQFALKLEQLAEYVNIDKELTMSKETSLLLIEYRLRCERLAEEFPEHEEIQKAEMSHRYFKVLKLAGAYAFIDDRPEVSEEHVYQAIKLAEESGEAFHRLMTRDRNHVKLAKYFASCRTEVTLADMMQDLPFFRGTQAAKLEMLTLARAWGYSNNIIIKKAFRDGIEFYRGESLKETNLEELYVSYSDDIATSYRNQKIKFDDYAKLVQMEDMHWINHHLDKGYEGHGHRAEENVVPGFNVIVLDVDKNVPMETVKMFLKDHKYIIYTTKRHQLYDEVEKVQYGDRFRVILPTNFELALDAKDFKEFMVNVFNWLPFECDTATGQRARKWLTHKGEVIINDGELFDVLPFIPKTSKEEEQRELLKDQAAYDRVERWFLNNIGDGNRNTMLHRFAMMLVQKGASINEIQSAVLAFNSKIADKLDEMEIVSTIMVSVIKAVTVRDAK